MATDQTSRLEAATVKAENGSDIIYRVANGDDQTDVETLSGSVPSMAKQSRLNRELILSTFTGTFTSPFQFGVKGDGVTDDTQAIRAAIASGKSLCWSPGNYLVSETVLSPDEKPQSWLGLGRVTFTSAMAAGSPARPMFDFVGRIISIGDFVVDHRANQLNYSVPTQYQGNVITGSSVLVQSNESRLDGWRFINAWDNGVSAVKINPADGKEYPGLPKHGGFSNITTRGCGVGEHAGLTPGKIGGGIDVGSASCWTVSDWNDFESYLGINLDVGAGAQCMFANCIAWYTKIDTNNPTNGSGYGMYVGSSESGFVNCGSVGSEGRGIWIDGVGNDFTNCFAFYSQKEGLFIKKGQIKGQFRVKGASAKGSGQFDAVLIDSSAGNITEMVLDLHVTGSLHRWGVNTQGANGIEGYVYGSINPGTAGKVNRQSYNLGTYLPVGKKTAVNKDNAGMEFDVLGRFRAGADRAMKSYLTDVVGDSGDNGSVFFEAFTTAAKRLAGGYDEVNDAWIWQAIHAGVGKKPMLLNPSGGEVMGGQGTWNNAFRLGAYRLWVDGNGLLRIKNGAPTSATDGTVVGTQTG